MCFCLKYQMMANKLHVLLETLWSLVAFLSLDKFAKKENCKIDHRTVLRILLFSSDKIPPLNDSYPIIFQSKRK